MIDDDSWSASASPMRVRAADALRELADALLDYDASEDELDELAELATEAAARLRKGRSRSAAVDRLKRGAYDTAPADGDQTRHNPDCIVCGAVHPAGFGMVVHRHGDAVRAEMTVGSVGRGAPDRIHGGILALALDDLMGHVLVLLGQPAYTVRLDVEYLGAARTHAPLELTAEAVDLDGRRLTIDAAARQDGTEVARARALFITVDKTRL